MAFVILCGKRCFSVINKVEEIRISCECVGGLILEAIPNKSWLTVRCRVYSRVVWVSMADSLLQLSFVLALL